MSQIPFERVIWTAEECAQYLRVSTKYFLRAIRYERGFPPALTGPARHPRWSAKAVTDWVLSPANPTIEGDKAA